MRNVRAAMKTFSEAIEAFGGPPAVAAALGGLPTTTVDSWRRRESIPSEYWRRLEAAANKKGIAGVNFGRLAEIASAKRRRRPRRAA